MKRIIAAVFLALPLLAAAESWYVIEQLVVSVSDTPGGAGERIATVRSGDRVEVLERFGDEARVRLASGSEGWMKAAYLSADTPLRLQLAERTRDLESARAALSRAERELAAARVAATQAQTRAQGPPPATAAFVPTGRPLFPSRAPGRTGFGWPWIAGGSLLGLAAGFAIGWRVLDRRIRRKYGGLRIY